MCPALAFGAEGASPGNSGNDSFSHDGALLKGEAGEKGGASQ